MRDQNLSKHREDHYICFIDRYPSSNGIVTLILTPDAEKHAPAWLTSSTVYPNYYFAIGRIINTEHFESASRDAKRDSRNGVINTVPGLGRSMFFD